jgi:7-cyano-7-deazaguanine synthase
MSTVLLYSGGLDSTVLLKELLDQGTLKCAVSVNYGQRHDTEISRAAYICDQWRDADHVVVDLKDYGSLLHSSSQTNPALVPPDGHYADASMRVTVVPNRNMVMLALAASIAIDQGADTLAYAAHAGDHAIYPDCRPEFIDALAGAFALCHYSPAITLVAPFARMTKAEIVKRGHEINAPMHLTYSCYKGGLHHCGTCGTCTERREAFILAGVEDPTTYDSHTSYIK